MAREVLEKAKSLSHELIIKTNAEKESQKELVEKLNAQSSHLRRTSFFFMKSSLKLLKI